ncbi:MAG: membrane protein insertion efficiency factor YidD [Patescibacteria group bacterium]
MKRLVLRLIKLYQKFPTSLHTSCRFQPRCSDYTYSAIEKYGILAGILKGIFRILRCNPLFKAKYDPVN